MNTERRSHGGRFETELPELEPGENPLLRVIRGEDGLEREVEDKLLPKLIYYQRNASIRKFKIDELVKFHQIADRSTVRRIFRQEGATYQILSIGEEGIVGHDSIAIALDGPNAGRRFLADIGRGARLKSPLRDG